MRGVARAAGFEEEAAETAWDPDLISAPRSVREGLWVPGCTWSRLSPRERRCSEEVLHRSAASPGKIHALLAKR